MQPRRSFLSRSALFGAVLALAATSIACGESSDSSGASFAGDPGSNPGASSGSQNNGGNYGSNNSSQGAAARAIEEADIVQLEGGRLYALSKSGSLAIIDVSQPGRLAMLGQAYLPGEPFEMYLRGDLLVAMTNGAYSVSGSVNEPAQQQPSSGTSGGIGDGESKGGAPAPSSPTSSPVGAKDPSSGAGVIVINVKDPGLMQRVATFPVAGEIADSRIVGNILYLATYENSTCYRCGALPRTMVTTFDIAAPSTMRQVDQVSFDSAPNATAYGVKAFKRSIVVTKERMYVGGPGNLSEFGSTQVQEGVIDVLDVTDPSGKLGKGAQITTAGAIVSRWQMDERNGVLRVVSQRGEGRTPIGIGMPEIETFNIWNTRSLQPMGKSSMRLPRQEGLKSVRFDQDRAYAITFAETDPLFVIDLKDPAAPKQRGELVIPGYVFHMEPHGDRVLGLGVDRRDAGGNLNVSLFDVANMDKPRMLTRVSFGPHSYSNNDAIAQNVLAEDQDRIQKAFRVLDGGLVVVPYSGAPTYNNGALSSCGSDSGVQLIDWSQDTLTKRSTLPMAGNPRRALLNAQTSNELIAVSDSNVTLFDISQRGSATKTADLSIGSCESRLSPNSDQVFQPNNGFNRNGGDWEGNDDFGPRWLCSSSGAGSQTRGACWAGLLLGLVAVGGAVRRRRSGV